MKNFLEIIIRPDGLTVCDPVGNGRDEHVSSEETSLDGRLARFSATHGISTANAVLFVAEELLFFKQFALPVKTPNLKDAINFQLGLLTPFASDSLLYSYSTTRNKDVYQIALYATPRRDVQPYLQKLSDAGFTILGLFPESQRYVTRTRRKLKWALLLPGRYPKAMVFVGHHMENRFLCGSDPEFSRIAEFCDTVNIYRPNPADNSGFTDAALLRVKPPLLKKFDLLPPVFKKPDYARAVIVSLLVLNLIALLGLAGIKQYRLVEIEQQLTHEISEIMPRVREIDTLRAQEKQLTKDIERIQELSKSQDLITFLKRLNDELPKTSFLDQLRMDQNKNTIHIQGYTEDIGELTAKLQAIGQTKLKSTSRRRDETYFQLEISLL
jgi:hypothetical protein